MTVASSASGDFSMNDITQRQLSDALARMHQALAVLDEAGAPGGIAAHLELAVSKLQDLLGLKPRHPDFNREQISRANPGPDVELGESQSAWDIARLDFMHLSESVNCSPSLTGDKPLN